MDNFTPGQSEKLVQYMDGELAAEEKTALEQQLATDDTLLAELESLQATREAIRWYGLQQKVAAIHGGMMEEKLPKQKSSGTARRIIRFSMAAAASLLLLVGGYLAYEFFTLSAEKVYNSKYQAYELITVRDGNTVETPVEKAYREKNYREVLRLVDAGNDRSMKTDFLCGAAALALQDNKKAIACFKTVLDANTQSGETRFNDEAEYYLSLGYIRNGDYDAALVLLKKIKADVNHTYHKQVTGKLIRQVKLLRRK